MTGRHVRLLIVKFVARGCRVLTLNVITVCCGGAMAVASRLFIEQIVSCARENVWPRPSSFRTCILYPCIIYPGADGLLSIGTNREGWPERRTFIGL